MSEGIEMGRLSADMQAAQLPAEPVILDGKQRWIVWACLSGPFPTETHEDGSTSVQPGGGTLDHYIVRKQDVEKEYGPYKSLATAQRRRDELERQEAQGPLDPKFAERRKRLKRLCPDFGGIFYDGPHEARWPLKPGRYLVRDGGVGWHAESCDELADDLAAVEAAIAGDEANVYEVVDLDTGDRVPFERTVTVQVGP